MISVLIPVYNYDVTNLVTSIHKQLQLCEVAFEILCLDDASTSGCSLQNQSLSNLEYVSYSVSKTNNGRTGTRQLLSEQAKYDWLLFLDADVIPKSEQFISTYLSYTNSEFDAIYGGICYASKAPETDLMLRWTYGRAKEEVKASVRNKTVYKSIVSANFMIKAAVFKRLNFNITDKGYGYDNYFATCLSLNKTKVIHIDNEVFHEGLETNDVYISKKENAAETLLKLYNSGMIKSHQNDLLKLYIQLKRFKLRFVLSLIYRAFKSTLKRNLTSGNPSIKLLQLYRICYMCHIDLKK